MKNSLRALLTVLVSVALLPACVSNKKYLAAKGRISALQSDSTTLEGRIAVQEKKIADMESRISQMQATNRFTSDQLNQSQEEIAQQRQRLEQLQTLINQQQANTEALRKKIADALVNFSSDQLTVTMKNGRVYVSMQESLLFPSGSADVNTKGKEALGTLATVLNQNQDINVQVQGHTDSLPITKRYEDNWALSVARATSITRILINDYKVDPVRITASGRSQYEPIAPNSTPEGRTQNRRTEIILEPKLDQLMDLINGTAPPGK